MHLASMEEFGGTLNEWSWDMNKHTSLWDCKAN